MIPKEGFVLGKFMPPHKGHVFLCEFAKRQCQHLTILVCSLPDDPIPGHQRHAWMKALFPDCTVSWCEEVVQQTPHGEEDSEFWAIWRDIVMRYGSGRCDVVFASENYGVRLAHEVGARFVPCDMGRQAVPISGTACRTDPAAHWRFLPDIVKPNFVSRVCLFGPESSGKSTLAEQLAEHYNTISVPEYGRTYTDTFGTKLERQDLHSIAAGHSASVAAAMALSGPILIEDTDPLMTAVWSEMLFGQRDPWFDDFTGYADFYLLCNIDIPWTDDGTRYFPGPTDRRRFFALCQDELVKRGVRYIVVSGDREARLKAAISAIDSAIVRK